jgi:ABC-type uncharacterized transport system permease subunit
MEALYVLRVGASGDNLPGVARALLTFVVLVAFVTTAPASAAVAR